MDETLVGSRSAGNSIVEINADAEEPRIVAGGGDCSCRGADAAGALGCTDGAGTVRAGSVYTDEAHYRDRGVHALRQSCRDGDIAEWRWGKGSPNFRGARPRIGADNSGPGKAAAADARNGRVRAPYVI